jgi:hypothetical protein
VPPIAEKREEMGFAVVVELAEDDVPALHAPTDETVSLVEVLFDEVDVPCEPSTYCCI